MLEPNHFIDLQRNVESFEDPRSWLSEDQDYSSSNSHPNNNNNRDGNFDRVLFRNLVEMVPLVESLMVPPSSLHLLYIQKQKHLLLSFRFFLKCSCFSVLLCLLFSEGSETQCVLLSSCVSHLHSHSFQRFVSQESTHFFFWVSLIFYVFVCILIWMLFWDAEFMVGWFFILVFVLERYQLIAGD